MIPYEDLQRVNRPFEKEFRKALEEMLFSGRYVLGEQVAEFERELASSVNIRHAVGVGSGYDALTIAFLSLGLRTGEVVVPANTHMSTIMAVMRCGLTPVLCDPDPKSLLVDPVALERRITSRTVALLPVHLHGLMCDMEAVMAIARRRRLYVVEDCAQAQGARQNSRPAGSYGHAAAFSFYPTKNLGALGDGGAVVTPYVEVADTARTARNYGARVRCCAEFLGFNSRLDELQASFLRIKLPAMPDLIRRKNRLAERYDQELDPDLDRLEPVHGTWSARHLYPVFLDRRDELGSFLRKRGIGTEIHYPLPPHRQNFMRRMAAGSFPVTEAACGRTLSLPLSAGHTDEEIDMVIRSVNEFMRANKYRIRPVPGVCQPVA